MPAAVAGHAAVTLASHRRQQGGHAVARRLDARALVIVGSAGRPDPADRDGTDAAAARVDALVGLAADALGLGDPAASRLLDAAAAIGHPSWRPRVRLAWVRAEAALFAGRASDAVAPAEQALVTARAAGAERHVLKSRLILAVVTAAVDRDGLVAHPDGAAAHPDGAVVAELDDVADASAAAGLWPLVWPARLAAADALDRLGSPNVSGSSPSANDGPAPMVCGSVNDRVSGAARRRHAAATTVSVLYQLSDPVGRRLMGESVWVPTRARVM